MEEDLNAKIAIKQKEVAVERDSKKKTKLQKQLSILILKRELRALG